MKLSYSLPPTPPVLLTLASSAYVAAVLNTHLWCRVWAIQDDDIFTTLILCTGLFSLITWIGFGLFSLAVGKVKKPALIGAIFIFALLAYFLDHYSVMLDRAALQSTLETDLLEAQSWLSWRLGLELIVFAVLPSILIWNWPVSYVNPVRTFMQFFAISAILLVVAVGAYLIAPRAFSSLARNHPELRHQIITFSPLNALRNQINLALSSQQLQIVQPIGEDAVQIRPASVSSGEKPRVLLIVIGESARASSFSLGGYGRETNPMLKQHDVVYFPHVSSCGTNTATSLPCMFLSKGQRQYRDGDAKREENLLDVIERAGFNIEWEDNNTGSKSLADRIKQENRIDIKTPDWCDAELCLDDLLVDHLKNELPDTHADAVFILHMIGSHGPDYFARYPRDGAVFLPDCRSSDLQSCSDEQVRNSYDNTIHYTDAVLDRMIKLLKSQSETFDSALFYVSDHGESTGENGFYLHGAPKLFAPAEQTEIPMLFWSSADFARRQGLNMECLIGKRAGAYSHDNFFHSMLGLLAIQTHVVNPDRDLFASCMQN